MAASLSTNAINGHGPLLAGVRVRDSCHHGAGATCPLVAEGIGAQQLVVMQEGGEPRGWGNIIPHCDGY